jgi:hypothetical protein
MTEDDTLASFSNFDAAQVDLAALTSGDGLGSWQCSNHPRLAPLTAAS